MPVRAVRNNDSSPDSSLVGLAVEYLRYKKDEENAKKEKDKVKKKIVPEIKKPENHEKSPNGHLEADLPLGDGLNNVFIQLQKRVSVAPVANALELLEQKLGKEAIEPYVVTQRVLHPNALEQLYMKEKLTAEDIEELTVERESEALIVKANKRK